MLQAQQTATPVTLVALAALAQRLLILVILTKLTILALLTIPTYASDTYRSVIAGQEKPVLEFLRTFEALQEQLHPAKFVQLQSDLSKTVGNQFVQIRAELNELTPPPELKDFDQTWREAIGLLDTTYGIFVRSDRSSLIGAFLQSRAAFTRARYRLYAIRQYTPTLQQYWVLPEAVARLAALEKKAVGQKRKVGFMHQPRSSNHGAYSLYVPENYDPDRHWPLIIALHGGSGMDDEYLLTWLRPAKSKGYIVLAPKSLGRTWAIENPDTDVLSIVTMLNRIRAEYAIDPDRILVTGLSDGGTFAYALGSSRPNLFGGVAPIAGLLPPWFDVKKAKALPILIIHGAQDFIFPVMTARMANATLIGNGFAEVTYKELADWGHAYTYSINEELVLPWFEALFQ